MTSWCYFIFRVDVGGVYNAELPDGGVVVEASTEVEAVAKAYQQAERQLPCKPGQLVICHPVWDEVRCDQAQLMQQDWERALQKFEELMRA